jgi:hypothetical protein
MHVMNTFNLLDSVSPRLKEAAFAVPIGTRTSALLPRPPPLLALNYTMAPLVPRPVNSRLWDPTSSIAIGANHPYKSHTPINLYEDTDDDVCIYMYVYIFLLLVHLDNSDFHNM